MLAIIAIGSASASEEISDDTAAMGPTDDAISESVDEMESVDDAPVQAVEEEITDSGRLSETEDDIINDFEISISWSQYNSQFSNTLVSTHSKDSNHRSGNLSFYVNGTKKVNRSVRNGDIISGDWSSHYNGLYASELGITKYGIYTIKVTFIDDDFKDDLGEVTIKEETIPIMNVVLEECYRQLSANETSSLYIKFPDVTSGNVTVYERTYDEAQGGYVNGQVIGSAEIKDEMAIIEMPILSAGRYDIFIEYSTNIDNGNRTSTIYVMNNSENVAVSVSPEIELGKNAVLTFKTDKASYLYVGIDGKMVTFYDADSVKYLIPDLSLGTHYVKVYFNNYDYDEETGMLISRTFYSNTFKITVKKPAPAPAPTPAPAVKKLATKILAAKKTFKVKAKVKKYTITLKAGNKIVKKVKVTLKVKGKNYKATTNSKGKATFKIKNLKKKGKYTAVIKFAGNKNYKASSKKAKLTVKK